MTTFNIATHRGVFAKSLNPADAEVLWFGDIQARLLELMLGSTDVKISLTEPADQTALWYQPHATNAGNGTFKVYASGAWQTLTASRLFTYLRLKAGYSPSGGGGSGVVDDDYGDVVVSDEGTVWTIDNNVVSNGKLADMEAWTFKMRHAGSTGDPSNIAVPSMTANSAPAATRLLMTFDPTTGEPNKSTITQLLSNVPAVADGGVGSYIVEATSYSVVGQTWVQVGLSWHTDWYVDSGTVVKTNPVCLWRRTA